MVGVVFELQGTIPLGESQASQGSIELKSTTGSLERNVILYCLVDPLLGPI